MNGQPLNVNKEKDGNHKTVNRDLSYGEILARQPAAWLVKFFFMNAIKKVKKGT